MGAQYREAATTLTLHVQLTGDMSVSADGKPARHHGLRSAQARTALAVLVLERTRPVTRDELAASLWPDEPPRSWESVLRTAVTRVRATFEAAGLDGRTALRAASDGYHLWLPEATVVDLELAAAEAETAFAAGRSEDVADRLDRAAGILRRPFLPSVDSEWVRHRRSGQRALLLRVLEALAEARLAAGSVLAAAEIAREVIDLDQFRESAHRLLLRALAAGGNRAQALGAYDQCRRLLADELGVDPAPETAQLFNRLLHAEPADRDVSVPPALPGRLRRECDGIFAGRAHEREVLQRRVEQGPPGIVLLEGTAGIGKTALVARVGEHAHAQGTVVLYGRCDEEVTLAYRPITEALTQLGDHLSDDVITRHLTRYGTGLLRLVPELGQRLSAQPRELASDPDTERHLLFRAVAMLLATAVDGPVMLVIDDLHWADRPSLALLRHLAGALDSSRVVIVATYRGDELADGPRAHTIHDLMRYPGTARVCLRGLADDDLVPLVESAAGATLGDAAHRWARTVGEETGGNPFFARELLRHLAEHFADMATTSTGWLGPATSAVVLALPDTIRDLITRRVHRLGTRAATVLRNAAVIGATFDVDVLTRVVDMDEHDVLDDIDRCLTAGILVEVPSDGGRFAFAHALVHRALYDQTGAARRRLLHREVACALEAQSIDITGLVDTRVGETARHWLLGHRSDERRHAAGWACAAGTQALATLAPDQALVWFQDALDRLGGRPDADELYREALIGLGEAQRGVGDQTYRDTLLTAGRSAAAAGDTPRLVRAAVANNRGAVSRSGNLDKERIGLLESAIAAIGDRAHPQRPLLGAILSVELDTTQESRRCHLADEAVRGARESGDAGVLGRVLALRFEATWRPSTHRGRLADTEELSAIAACSPDPRLRFLAARLNGLVAWEGGLIHRSDEHLATEHRLAEEIGEPYLRWIAALSRAARLQASSRLAEAQEAADTAMRIGSAAGEPDAPLAYGAQLLHLRRQQGRADELLPTLADIQGTTDYDVTPMVAFIHAESGANDAASAASADLLAQPIRPPASPADVESLCLLAEVVAAIGDTEAARRLYDCLHDCTGLFFVNQVARHGPLDRQLGLLAACHGDLPTAIDHLTTAADAATSTGLPYWAAEAQVALARALLRRDDDTDQAHARSLLAQAGNAAARFGFARTRAKIAETGASATTV